MSVGRGKTIRARSSTKNVSRRKMCSSIGANAPPQAERYRRRRGVSGDVRRELVELTADARLRAGQAPMGVAAGR